MKRLICLVCLSLVLLSGCTITKVKRLDDADFRSKLNQFGLRNTGALTASDGSRYEARAIRLDGDSLTFLRVRDRAIDTAAPPEVIKMGVHEIRDVKFVHHVNGAMEGLALGALGGFAFGFAVGAASAHEECEGFLDLTCGSPASVGAGFGLVFALPSGFIGLIAGAIRGKQYRFYFDSPRPIRFGRGD